MRMLGPGFVGAVPVVTLLRRSWLAVRVFTETEAGDGFVAVLAGAADLLDVAPDINVAVESQEHLLDRRRHCGQCR